MSAAEIIGGWCPACRVQVATMDDGRCAWCNAQTGAGDVQPLPSRNANAGVPVLMGDDVLHEARALYAGGLSMRQVAERLHPHTGYATVNSFASCLYRMFARHGWARRDQAQVTGARNYRHGHGARDRDESAYRKMLRAQRGQDCQATTAAGKPCSRRAIGGHDYCPSHDPIHAERRAALLAEARRKWAATWEPCQGIVENRERTGQPCLRRAIPGLGYCHGHRHQAPGELPEAA